MDHIDPEARSRLMAAVRSRDTGPELLVRRCLHRSGLRYRLHRRDLPGTPDVVLPRHKLVVLIHGCFWHRHAGCKKATMPKLRTEFWSEKFARNVERDIANEQALTQAGWRVAVIWECEARDTELVLNRVHSLLASAKAP